MDGFYKDAFALWSMLYAPAHTRNTVSPQISKEQATTLQDLPYGQPLQTELSR